MLIDFEMPELDLDLDFNFDAILADWEAEFAEMRIELDESETVLEQ